MANDLLEMLLRQEARLVYQIQRLLVDEGRDDYSGLQASLDHTRRQIVAIQRIFDRIDAAQLC